MILVPLQHLYPGSKIRVIYVNLRGKKRPQMQELICVVRLNDVEN